MILEIMSHFLEALVVSTWVTQKITAVMASRSSAMGTSFAQSKCSANSGQIEINALRFSYRKNYKWAVGWMQVDELPMIRSEVIIFMWINTGLLIWLSIGKSLHFPIVKIWEIHGQNKSHDPATCNLEVLQNVWQLAYQIVQTWPAFYHDRHLWGMAMRASRSGPWVLYGWTWWAGTWGREVFRRVPKISCDILRVWGPNSLKYFFCCWNKILSKAKVTPSLWRLACKSAPAAMNSQKIDNRQA